MDHIKKDGSVLILTLGRNLDRAYDLNLNLIYQIQHFATTSISGPIAFALFLIQIYIVKINLRSSKAKRITNFIHIISINVISDSKLL